MEESGIGLDLGGSHRDCLARWQAGLAVWHRYGRQGGSSSPPLALSFAGVPLPKLLQKAGPVSSKGVAAIADSRSLGLHALTYQESKAWRQSLRRAVRPVCGNDRSLP